MLQILVSSNLYHRVQWLSFHLLNFARKCLSGSAHSPEPGENIQPPPIDSVLHVTEDEDNVTSRPRASSNAAEQSAAAGGEKGYSIFFLRCLPVPPSRFRPPMVMGHMTVEHSQNFYLSKVLELNARLRSSFATSTELLREEGELKISLNNSADGTATSRQLKKVKESREKSQATSIEVWVNLQTTGEGPDLLIKTHDCSGHRSPLGKSIVLWIVQETPQGLLTTPLLVFANY